MRLGEISFDDVSVAQTFPQEVPLWNAKGEEFLIAPD
ncbi:hypothetical protein SAMN04489740_4062 [Arthrobacter alpinus]|uniref:Uncharacterized protein n=1 Tax=Arthrobacter alpinus TaxID=656366 RepID=A0A1H5PDA1_9MICC|nr:hypothetical protein SAMN04489740_4062 [Arthrobacter alpinus]